MVANCAGECINSNIIGNLKHCSKMTAFKHLRIVIFVLAVLVVASSSQSCPSKLSKKLMCPGIQRIPRGSGSCSGNWYLYASTPMNFSQAECSLFNTVYPCGCILGQVVSDCDGNYSTDLTVYPYSYNFKTNTSIIGGTLRTEQLETDDYSEISQYTLIDDPTFTFTTAKLGTDNKKSFLLIYICNNPKGITTVNGDAIIWFLSRTPVATPESIQEVNRILKKNKFSTNILKRVVQSNCEYPMNEYILPTI